MASAAESNDWLTVAAVGVLAMCVVTFDHEALGHGGACLLLHGHIRLLTSSLFRCDIRSAWIDPAGPSVNLLIGALAFAFRRLVPSRLIHVKLFLIFVTAFSFFWEGGYLMRAMQRRDGDLYFFSEFVWGNLTVWQRCFGALFGLAIFALSIRITSSALLKIWPAASVARSVARTVWLGATISSIIAASAYIGHGSGNLRDAVLEIAVASFPLLVIPFGESHFADVQAGTFVGRSHRTLVVAALIFALFVATLGRGVF